jgi:DNA-binding NarL/FixJ family response regulator
MSQQKIRVLVVDDHAMMRFGIISILRNAPDLEIVGEAGDAEEAIERYFALRPDVTIIDLRLAGMSGTEAIRRIRTENPNARFLALTANEDEVEIRRALDAGAGSYLLKGMRYRELLDAVRRVSAGDRFIPIP